MCSHLIERHAHHIVGHMRQAQRVSLFVKPQNVITNTFTPGAHEYHGPMV
jgi:hypothetical protein